MQIYTKFTSFYTNRFKSSVVKLVVVMLSGFLIGGNIGLDLYTDAEHYFVTVGSIGASFLGCVMFPLLPLFVTVTVVQLFSADAVLLVAFLKSVMFSMIAVACAASWGSAGWLVSRLMLFSSFLALPVLARSWYRALCKSFGKKEIVLSFVVLFIIGVFDYFWVSPFLCSLY